MFPPFSKQPPPENTQNSSLNICCNDDYLDLLFGASLPLDQVCYAFAYGSGAIPQKGENQKEKMVDFILVCNNSMLFHQKNQLWNPAHYSLPWRLFKTERLINNLYWFQRDGFLFPKGAKLFYNTLIPSRGRLIKYGVIDTEDFEADLLDWPKLYIAGRLHKPVLNVLVWPNDQNLGQEPNRPIWQAINDNRWMAVQAALLLLPEKFSVKEFLS
uniref:Phosphatidate cytidylyltransferase, mitochondrial n=1 Tax=Meloidogyne enterolobii TaxID=390850 RepID=A0A6V7VQE6_MELEN|nr:unnamed protein product [Meloidogyne enterolobii]